MQRFVALTIQLSVTSLTLWLIANATKLRNVDDGIAQFGFLNFFYVQISRHALRERRHRTVHRGAIVRL